MKLVSFAVATPIGSFQRLGALIDADHTERILDLTSAYATYLRTESGESRVRQAVELRVPPDMIGWLEGGPASREAAEQALAYVRRRLAS
jgi:hypothetical protein